MFDRVERKKKLDERVSKRRLFSSNEREWNKIKHVN